MNQRVDNNRGGPRRALGAVAGRAVDPVARASEQIAIGVVDRMVADGLPDRIVDHLLGDGLAERIAARILEGPELERIVQRALDSPTVERVVAGVIASRLMDDVVARLLESDDLWILVDEIARSPAVTEAIGQQGLGFADQLAADLRARSRRADARLEGAARRLVHRRDGRASATP